ncbi:MAG: fibronectin type III domain-containing protein, partial [Clostridia bacterium]|nr:fibronectin type III domain-containing protein [Clostridia bacterium]
MKHSVSQRVISTLLALLVVLGSFAVSAAAATTEEEYGGSYGYIIPTDSNLSAQKESYTFYGNSTTLYFMLFSNGRENSFYTVDIFSSDDYNPDNIVSSFTSQYNAAKGSVPLALNWPFKTNPSGTYYGRCYTSVINGEDEIIDKSTICKFTIKLNRVGKETVSLTSITNKTDGVTIKWTGLSTALKYRVYRKVKGDKKWTAIGDVKAGTTSFTDKKVQSGVQYTYTVKAFDNLYASLYDKAGLTTVFLTTPTITPSKASTNVYPVIKWSQVQGCQGYIVYRKGGSLNDSTKWKQVAKIKSPTTLTYTDKTATSADWKYSYTVRAYYGNFKSYYNTTGVDYEY